MPKQSKLKIKQSRQNSKLFKHRKKMEIMQMIPAKQVMQHSVCQQPLSVDREPMPSITREWVAIVSLTRTPATTPVQQRRNLA